MQACETIIAETGSKRPGHITATEVTRMWTGWTERKLAPATMRAYTQGLRWLLRYLGVAERIIQTIPRGHKAPPRGTTYAHHEIAEQLAAAEPGLRLYIMFCSDLAIRANTAMQMSEDDWDADAKVLRFTTKHNALVVLPVTERIAEMLAMIHRYPHPDRATPYVARLGGPNVRASPRASYRKKLIALQRDLGHKTGTSHDYRRSAARRLYDRTKDLRLVQALLGHASLETTLHYLYPQRMQLTAEQLEQNK